MTRPAVIADLHTHTIFSDGEMTPLELYEYYRRLDYEGLAITDHDTLAGAQQLVAHLAAKSARPLFVPGVELTLAIDMPDFRGSIHLLLYFGVSKLRDPAFLRDMEFLFSHARGPELLRRRIAKINAWLADRDPRIRLRESVFHSYAGQITRRAIFTELVGAGLPEMDARLLLANDSAAYVPSGVSLETAAARLRSHRLLRVLAHPGAGSYPGDSVYKEVHPPLAVIRSIVRNNQDYLKLDGLELYYPAHTAGIRADIRSLSAELDLALFTGGSDCHDMDRRPPGQYGLDRNGWTRFREALAAVGP